MSIIVYYYCIILLYVLIEHIIDTRFFFNFFFLLSFFLGRLYYVFIFLLNAKYKYINCNKNCKDVVADIVPFIYFALRSLRA